MTWNFRFASSVVSVRGVTVRLNLPAVKSRKSMSFFFSTLWRFGICATTPMEPRIAKGDATTLSATHAIIYPPEAATVSTHTVVFTPAVLRRRSWLAANPYSDTPPPGDVILTTTSSNGVAVASRSVTA